MRILCNETRLHVLLLLSEGEADLDTMCDEARQETPVLGNHLSILRDAGFVIRRRVGMRAVYRLTEEGRRLANIFLASGTMGRERSVRSA